MTKESKEFMKELYTICVLGMLIIALFYIIIIPDLEAYSESKTVYKCNNRVGNYNCFDKPIHREKKPKTLDDIYKQLEDEKWLNATVGEWREDHADDCPIKNK